MMHTPLSFNRSRFVGLFFVALGLILAPYAAVLSTFAAPLEDPLVNGSFEQAGASASRAYDWQVYGRGYTRVSDKKRSGAWSIRLNNTALGQQSGAYQRVDIHQASVKPVFVGAWIAGNNVTLPGGAWVGASIYAEIVLVDGTVVYWNSIKNSGTFDWRWIGFNTGSLPEVNQPIDHIFVVPILADGTGTAWFDDLTVAEFDPTQAAVTLMFDDGEISTYTEAKPALSSRGFVGTTAVVTSLVGDEGYMSLNQVKELAKAGWEITSHGVTHDDFTAGTQTSMRNQLRNSKQQLAQWGFPVQNVAYPFGAYNALLLAETKAAGYRSGRAYELGDNPQGAFPYDVKVRSAIDTTTAAEVAGWIAEAKTKKRWEVIVFHSIAQTGDDAYHTTPAAFRAILDAVKKSGVAVVTYNEGLNRFAVSDAMATSAAIVPDAGIAVDEPLLEKAVSGETATLNAEASDVTLSDEDSTDEPDASEPVEPTSEPIAAALEPGVDDQLEIDTKTTVADARTMVQNIRENLQISRTLRAGT